MKTTWTPLRIITDGRDWTCEAVKELFNFRGEKRGKLGLSITSDPHHVRQT